MSTKILVPLDGSILGEAAISYVKDLTAKFSAEQTVSITFFHVITELRHQVRFEGGVPMSVGYTEDELEQRTAEAMDYLENLAEPLRNSQVSVNCSVGVNEKPAKAIIAMEDEIGADLVAMSPHGKSGFSRFMGSVADKVMRGGTVPVLMVRADEL